MNEITSFYPASAILTVQEAKEDKEASLTSSFPVHIASQKGEWYRKSGNQEQQHAHRR